MKATRRGFFATIAAELSAKLATTTLVAAGPEAPTVAPVAPIIVPFGTHWEHPNWAYANRVAYLEYYDPNQLKIELWPKPKIGDAVFVRRPAPFTPDRIPDVFRPITITEETK